MEVPQDDFTIGWEDRVYNAINKRGAKLRIDGETMNNVEPYSSALVTETDVKKYFFFIQSGSWVAVRA